MRSISPTEEARTAPTSMLADCHGRQQDREREAIDHGLGSVQDTMLPFFPEHAAAASARFEGQVLGADKGVAGTSPCGAGLRRLRSRGRVRLAQHSGSKGAWCLKLARQRNRARAKSVRRS